MSQVQDAVIALQSRIFKEKYYVGHWVEQLGRANMSTATIDQHEHPDKQLILLCHHMWESLPDSKEIRWGPFYDLCNIAEKIFDGDDT